MLSAGYTGISTTLTDVTWTWHLSVDVTSKRLDVTATCRTLPKSARQGPST